MLTDAKKKQRKAYCFASKLATLSVVICYCNQKIKS